MIDLFGWIVAPLALTMLIERAEKVSRWLIKCAADAVEDDRYREEWLADLEAVEGSVWKLWHGVGICIRCLPAIIAKRRGSQTEKRRDHRTDMRRLRRKFTSEAWHSLLNAAEVEADGYHFVNSDYRIEFVERWIVEHGLEASKAMVELKRLDRSSRGRRQRLIRRSKQVMRRRLRR